MSTEDCPTTPFVRRTEVDDGDRAWRYRTEFEIKDDGRVFRLHHRYADPSFDYRDVLLTVSLAVTVAAVSKFMPFEISQASMQLRHCDAIRLEQDLEPNIAWPKWSTPTSLLDGDPQDGADLTVVLVAPR